MRHKIEKLVNKLYKKYKTRNPIELAEKLDLIVVSQDMDSSVHGAYYYKVRNGIICLNTIYSEEHQKYVLAHEIGHYLLHKKLNIKFLQCSTFYSKDKFEKQANMFAAEYLISDELLEQYTTIDELSQMEGIPKEIVKLKFEIYSYKLK